MSGNGTAVATQDERSALDTFIEKMKPKAMQALADKMDPDAFMLGVETAFRKTPKLLQCSQVSLFVAIATCAEAGLVPLYDLAYLIPRGKEATLQFGYKGLIELALRSGRVSKIEAHLVHEGDDFDYQLGLNPDITHRPTAAADGRPITHVYAIAWPTDRGAPPWFEVMTRAEVEHVKKTAVASNSPAWSNYEGQMYRKTAIRRLMNYLPLRPRERALIERDDEEAFDFEERAEYEPVQGATRTEKIENLLAGDDPGDAEYLEGGVLDLGDVNGEHSITDLEEMAGFAKADRDALCERLEIKSPVHDPDKYADALREIIAERQEAEA